MFLYSAKMFHDQRVQDSLHPRSCGAGAWEWAGDARSAAVSARWWWLMSEMLQNLGQNRNFDAFVWVLSNLVYAQSAYQWSIVFVSVESVLNSSQSINCDILIPITIPIICIWVWIVKAYSISTTNWFYQLPPEKTRKPLLSNELKLIFHRNKFTTNHACDCFSLDVIITVQKYINHSWLNQF